MWHNIYMQHTIFSMKCGTNTKIIPYCIVGDYKFRSKNLKIVFGEAIHFKDETIEEANEILFNTIKDLLLENK